MATTSVTLKYGRQGIMEGPLPLQVCRINPVPVEQAIALAERIVRDTAGNHIQHPESIEFVVNDELGINYHFWVWDQSQMRLVGGVESLLD